MVKAQRQNASNLALVVGTHSFRYRSTMRGGDFHIFENMDTGASSVITNATYKMVKPFLNKSGNLFVYPKDKLPASICLGLSIPTMKSDS